MHFLQKRHVLYLQSEVDFFLIKPHQLGHKETLNGLNQAKGFEQSSKV